MATYTKYEPAIENMLAGNIISFGTTNTWRAVIHTDAPVPATDDELVDLTQITGTGYTAGGDDLQNNGTRSGATVTVAGVDITWTAGAGDWTTTARYVSAHDDTSTGDKLIASWDYGSTFALGNGETFTLDLGTDTIFTAS